jgi:hypothetical protein
MKYNIFPTPVWHIEGAPQQLIDDLCQQVSIIKKNIHQYQHAENVIVSNEGGYQTTQFAWKDFHPTGIEYIENVVNNIFSPKTVPPKPTSLDGKEKGLYSVSISGWWYNINPQGAWNTPHNHAGNDYALVFYITDSDSLLRFLTPHNSRINEPNHQSINAKKGDILIFPSDLGHYVMPNPREEDRVSISMNLQLC